MDSDTETDNMVRQREEDDDTHNGRNVRRNIGVVPRNEPFVRRIEMNIRNIEVVRSQTGSVLRRSHLNPNSRLISLHNLITQGSQHGTAAVFFILGISLASSGQTQVQQRYNGARGAIQNQRHSRKLTIMCPLSPPGSNTAIILQGNGNCPRLFDGDITLRDGGAIRPGALIVIVNPPSTDRFVAHGTTPILSPQRPILVINSNFEFPQRPIVTEGTDVNGFILHNCRVNLRSFQVIDSPCGGNLCDHQSLMNGEIMTNRCCCIQMMNRVGNVVVLFDIEVVTNDGATFQSRMSSKWFMKQFLLTGDFPAGTRAFRFEDYEVEDRIFNTASQVFNYINSIGGFQIVGWVKRGEVEDQGVDQPNNGLPHNAQRVMVQSGSLNHHISRMEPVNPERVNLMTLNEFKFDVNDGFNNDE